MKKPYTLVSTVATVLLLFATLFFSISLVISRPAFFEKEYTKLGNAQAMGMSVEDLTAATAQMVAYMDGSAQSIDLEVTVNGERVSMFNDRERAHMVDVRALYQGIQKVAIAALVISGIAILGLRMLSRKKKEVIQQQYLGVFWGSGACFMLILAFGLWVLVDFNSFWTAFHHLFFTNDLWLLDPATSRMINMMPWELFYDIVVHSGLCFLIIWAMLFFASLVQYKRGCKEEKAALEKAGDQQGHAGGKA